MGRAPWAHLGVVLWMLGTIAWIWSSEDAVWIWTFDDAFYYFEIARNLADGAGSTFDRITTTNGYHPLWMAVCTLVYAMGLDGLGAVRALLSLQLLLHGAVTLAGLGLLARHLDDQPVAIRQTTLVVAALLAVNPSVVNVFVNGVEAAVSLPFQAAVLAWLLARDEAPAERAGLLALSLLLTGAFLARTDAGLLVLAVLLWSAVRSGVGRHLVVIGALPALALALFLGANQLWFDTPTQVSGDLKRVTPGALQWGLIAVMVGLAAALARVPAAGGFPRTRQVLRRSWPFGAFCCLVVAYYLGFQTFPRVWYFVPVALWLVVLAWAGTADLLVLALSEARDKDPDVAPMRAIAPLAAIAVVTLGGALVGGAVVGSSGVHHSRRANAEAGRWITANLPADAILGSWDAGVVGYFAAQRVVNLDGVVNSAVYKEALRGHRAGPLVAGWGVTLLVNHAESAEELEEAAHKTLGDLDRFEVRREWPFSVVGGVNTVGMSEHEMAVYLVDIGRGPVE